MSAAWCRSIGWISTPVDDDGWSVDVVNHIRLATTSRDLATAAALAALPT